MITITNKVKVTFNSNVKKKLDNWKVLLLLGSNNPHNDTMSSAYPFVTSYLVIKIQCYFAQMITIIPL